MPRDHEHVTFDGEVVARTDKAVRFRITDLDDEEVWFPLSQCELDNSETSILCPVWLAKTKGLA